MKIVRSIVMVAFTLSLALVAAACSSGSGGNAAAPKGGAIESRDWQVRQYAEATGTMKEAFLTVPLYARFEAGTVSGTAGCSQFSASFAIDGAKLTVTGLQVGTEVCDSYATGGRDTYMAALPLTATFNVADTEMTFYDKDGRAILQFKEK
ncbi:MAG TPA: META domain-containing protein [Candidatus Limnocylindrales bacterium]